jgi:hypothetical protein
VASDQPSEPGIEGFHAQRKKRHRLDLLVFAFVLCAAIAAVCAAYFTYRQWQTAQRSLVVSARAFVHRGEFRIFHANDPDPAKGEYLAIETALVNAGDTRTTGLQFFVRCVTTPSRLIEPWELLQAKEEHLPQVIAPRSAVPTVCAFPRSDVAQISQGRLYGYVLGEVTYRDIFEPALPHITQFSLIVTVNRYVDSTPFGADVQFAAIGRHNCADEDCPK